MADQPIILRGRAISRGDMFLMTCMLTLIVAGVAMIVLLVLDSALHAYLTLRIDAILAGTATILLSVAGVMFLIYAAAIRMRRIGEPMLEIGDDAIWLRRFSAFLIPWSDIDRLQLNQGHVSVLTIGPSRRFALDRWAFVLDFFRGLGWHVIGIKLDEFDMAPDDVESLLRNECRAHGCVFEEKETVISSAKPYVSYLSASVGLVIMGWGAWELARGWFGLATPPIEIIGGRVSNVETWYFRGNKHDIFVGHDILTFTLAGRRERFSIHDYEPGYVVARRVVNPGGVVDVVAEPSSERNLQGHRVLSLRIQGAYVTDRANSLAYKVWIVTWLIAGTSFWLLGAMGSYFVARETRRQLHRRSAKSATL